MTNQTQKELGLLEDEYIDRRIAGEDIDIDEYCNRPYLTNEEKQELGERLRIYEASQKGMEKWVEDHIDADAVWKRISARIKDKPIDMPRRTKQEEVLPVAAEDSGQEEKLKAKLMDEFADRTIKFRDYVGEIIYRDVSSVILVFEKDDAITTDLDGCIIHFYVDGQERTERVDRAS